MTATADRLAELAPFIKQLEGADLPVARVIKPGRKRGAP